MCSETLVDFVGNYPPNQLQGSETKYCETSQETFESLSVRPSVSVNEMVDVTPQITGDTQ